jgi:hypothetical protein
MEFVAKIQYRLYVHFDSISSIKCQIRSINNGLQSPSIFGKDKWLARYMGRDNFLSVKKKCLGAASVTPYTFICVYNYFPMI